MGLRYANATNGAQCSHYTTTRLLYPEIMFIQRIMHPLPNPDPSTIPETLRHCTRCLLLNQLAGYLQIKS